MIFIRYESMGQYWRLYRLNSILILLMIGLFVLAQFTGGGGSEIYIRGIIANYEPARSELWRYVTAIFLHADFAHLLFNVFAQFVFVAPLERLLGRGKFLLFYLLCGVIGNAGSVLLSDGPMAGLGASGAIYGAYGAYLFMAIYQRHLLDPSSRTTIYVILGLGVVMSLFTAQVNFWAHFIGGVAGLLLYRVMGNPRFGQS